MGFQSKKLKSFNPGRGEGVVDERKKKEEKNA